MLKEVDKGKKDDKGNPIMSTELWDANAIEVKDPKTLILNLKEPQVAVPEHFFHYPFPMLDPKENGVWGVKSNGTGAFSRSRSKLAARPWSRRSTATAPISMPSSSSISATTLPRSGRRPCFQAGARPLSDQYRAVRPLQSMDHVNRYDAITAHTCVARMQPIQAVRRSQGPQGHAARDRPGQDTGAGPSRHRQDCRAPSRLAGSPRLQEAPDDDAEHRGGEEAA